MDDKTFSLVLSSLMGLFGGLFSIPINALFSYWLKRDEISYKNKLDMIATQRELLLKHKLEMASKAKDDELLQIKTAIERLEQRIRND